MKAIIEFNLPEDSDEHQIALDGWKWRIAVQEIDNKLRAMLKYEEKETFDIETMREFISSMLSDQNITLDW